MPLLKPPEPQMATRRLYVRLDEHLANTAERYAEFIGTHKLDHVVSQALQFIFKRDTQFKQWLTQHPTAPSRSSKPKSSSREQGNDGGQQ